MSASAPPADRRHPTVEPVDDTGRTAHGEHLPHTGTVGVHPCSVDVAVVAAAGSLRGFLARTAESAGLTADEMHAVLLVRLDDDATFAPERLAGAVGGFQEDARRTVNRLRSAGLVTGGLDGDAAELTRDGRLLADRTLAQLSVAIAARRGSLRR